MRYTIQTRNWLKLRRCEVKVWKRQTRLEYFTMLDQADRLIHGRRPIHREKIRFGAWEESPEVGISPEALQRKYEAIERLHGDSLRERITTALSAAGLPSPQWLVGHLARETMLQVLRGEAEL